MNEDIKELDIIATGINIKDLMDDKNISIRELSNRLNVSFQAVYRWQHGETLPTITNLFLLAQILQIGVDDILVPK